MQFNTLISIDALASRINDSQLVVFDCRHDLMKPQAGAQAYAANHIPNARFAHSDRDLAGDKTGRNGRHPLPDPAAFMRWLGSQGVARDTQVVGYDFSGGATATRLWWMLRHWLGHERIAVLDGGWEGWVAAGLPVTQAVPTLAPTTYTGAVRNVTVDVDYVASHLNHADAVVLDARSADRFRGEQEPIDPVAGHIPGARNRLYKLNLDERGFFKPAAALRAEFERVLAGTRPEQIVHQCGSGVSACHNILAMDIAGLNGSRLYPGSWSEWCSDPARPVERG